MYNTFVKGVTFGVVITTSIVGAAAGVGLFLSNVYGNREGEDGKKK